MSRPYLCFDTETLPLPAIPLGPAPFVVLGWKDEGGPVQFEFDLDRARRLVQDALDAGRRLVGFNMAFDFDVLGIVPPRESLLHDGMIGDFLLRLASDDCFLDKVTARFHSLAEVARISKDEDVTLSFRPGVPLTKVQSDYLIKDVLAQERVYLNQRDRVPGGDAEMALQVLARMALDRVGRTGIPIDHAERERQLLIFEQQQAEVAHQLHQAGFYRKASKGPRGGKIRAGTENKLFQAYVEKLADSCGLPVRLTDSGLVKLDRQYLGQFQHDPTVAAWLEYKDCEKIISQFLRGWDRDRVHGDVVRCRYTSMVRTGRTACSSPNLQQVPTRKGKGEIKRVFVAPPGRELYEIDFHQLELVCLAHLTQGNMKALINSGKDLHRELGAVFFHVPPEEVTKDQRQLMKCANFGMPGGMGRAKFRMFLRSQGVPDPGDAEVASLRNAWLALFPEMETWLAEPTTPQDRILRAIWAGKDYQEHSSYAKAAWELAYHRTRNRDLPAAVRKAIRRGIGSPEVEAWILNRSVEVKGGRRRAPVTYTEQKNTPFQGLAANLAKEALIALVFYPTDLWTVHAFIHDSVLLSIEAGRPDRAELAARTMLEAAALWVPDVRTGVEICGPGNTWYEAKCGKQQTFFRR